MNKVWIVIAAVLVIGIAAVFFLMGERAEFKTEEILKQAGLTPLNMQPAGKSLGAITYSDIILDEDSISTIKTLQASYGVGDGKILLDGLQMTGDTLEGLSISGFNFENFPYALAKLPLQTILIRNSSVSILTQDISGVSVAYEAQALRRDDALEYQMRFQSQQKYLSLRGQASGSIRSNEWTMEGDIEQSRFELPFLHMSATRANGRFTIVGHAGTPYRFSGQVNAGGAEIVGLPCKNLTVTLEMQGAALRIFGNAKALNQDDIEISVNGNENGMIYTVFAPTYEMLSKFLTEHKRGNFLDGAKLPKNATDITLNITRTKDVAAITGEAQVKDNLTRFNFSADWPV